MAGHSKPSETRAAGHEYGVTRMTYTSAANSLLVRFETYLAGVFHPVPQERVVAGAIQSFYTWFFGISPQRLHLRRPAVSGGCERERDAADIRHHRLCRAGGLLPVVRQCVGADPVSFREAQATRVLARCAGDTARSLVARLRDPGRNIVRHRRDREGARRVPHQCAAQFRCPPSRPVAARVQWTKWNSSTVAPSLTEVRMRSAFIRNIYPASR